MILWLSGPTGAGKSSFATRLMNLGFASVTEDVPESHLGSSICFQAVLFR